MIYERLLLMRDLLAEDGSIYVHCDWRINRYIRLALDEVFGQNGFAVKSSGSGHRVIVTQAKHFGICSQMLFYFTKPEL